MADPGKGQHQGPAWRAPSGLLSLLISLLGAAISAYLTVEHYDSTLTLACPESATINCAKVTTSPWSHIGAIPLALLGLIFFLAMALLCSPPAWRIAALHGLRIAAAVIGTLSVFYLIWVELFRVNAICLWCTGVHLCTVALLATVLWHGGEPIVGD
jgi:uncharacterized membrane protein